MVVLRYIWGILQASFDLWMDMAPYLLMGMLIAGVLHVFIGKDFISRHLGGRAFASIFKATLFGIPLPICSCGVIPVASSLRKEGASKSATLSFLVSTPTTGVDSILATYALMGPLYALFRPLAALFSGLTIGGLNQLFNKESDPVAREEARPEEPLSMPKKLSTVFTYGFFELAEDIAKYLVIGVLIGGALTYLMPTDLLLGVFSNPLIHFLLMLAIAVPLYVCATGSIPIAAALIQKGFSPGAALVFLIAGPATNTVTLSFVRSKLGKRAFYLYIISIITISAIAGLIFNVIFYKLGGTIDLITAHGTHLPHWLRLGSAVLLLGLIVRALFRFTPAAQKMDFEFSVPDMTCRHCQATVHDALVPLAGIRDVHVDLKKKVVGISGTIDKEKIFKAVKDAGYTAEDRS
ncbi:permease [bacterium]|nr:permease [bacterium]